MCSAIAAHVSCLHVQSGMCIEQCMGKGCLRKWRPMPPYLACSCPVVALHHAAFSLADMSHHAFVSCWLVARVPCLLPGPLAGLYDHCACPFAHFCSACCRVCSSRGTAHVLARLQIGFGHRPRRCNCLPQKKKKKKKLV